MGNNHAVNDGQRAAHPRAINNNLRRYAATAARLGGILHKGAVPFVDYMIAVTEMGNEVRRRRVAAGLPVWSTVPLSERSDEEVRLEAAVFADVIDDGIMDASVLAVKAGVEAFGVPTLIGVHVRGLRSMCESLGNISGDPEVFEAFDRMVERLGIEVSGDPFEGFLDEMRAEADKAAAQ